MNAVNEISFQVEQLDRSAAITSVPEAVVLLGTVRGLVVHQEHVLFLAGDVCNHLPGKGTLLHIPSDFIIFVR